MQPYVFRFAPTPNGRLHLGHACSAIVTHDMARRLGGRFLVRIEDIDHARARAEFEAGILEDLAWLGLAWDGPVVRQSQRRHLYDAAIARLDAMGLVYPCFASRRDITRALAGTNAVAVDPEGVPVYPGLHRDMPAQDVVRRKAAGETYALRLDMARAMEQAGGIVKGPLTFDELDADGLTPRTLNCTPERWGDVVIARKDIATSYHLSVVIDDADQGVTHVTRGADLFAATDVHRLLQVLLGLPAPLYHHHRLVLDGHERKLSKRDGAESLASYRDRGLTPDDIRARIGLDIATT